MLAPQKPASTDTSAQCRRRQLRAGATSPASPFTHFLNDFLTAGVAGSVAKTLNSPFEVAKLISQTQPERFNGLKNLFVELPRQEGFAAFWRGNLTNVLRYFPTQALNFAFKDMFRDLFMPDPLSSYSYGQQFLRGLAAGGCAGAVALPFVFPLDVCRTRLATDAKQGASGQRRYNGLVDVARKTVAADGPRGLFRGFSIAMIGIVPYRALYFGLFDILKSMSGAGSDSPVWVTWGIAQFSAVFAQTLVFPYDVTKRMFMKGGELLPDGSRTQSFDSIAQCVRHIYETRGWRGFYRGVAANTLRATGAALTLVLYDELKKWV